MVETITTHLSLPPNSLANGQSNAGASLTMTGAEESSGVILDPEVDDWSTSHFNYAEMSRIGDKTPEIDEAFLRYSTYFT
jgi:hypothetical protein